MVKYKQLKLNIQKAYLLLCVHKTLNEKSLGHVVKHDVYEIRLLDLSELKSDVQAVIVFCFNVRSYLVLNL